MGQEIPRRLSIATSWDGSGQGWVFCCVRRVPRVPCVSYVPSVPCVSRAPCVPSRVYLVYLVYLVCPSAHLVSCLGPWAPRFGMLSTGEMNATAYARLSPRRALFEQQTR